MESNTSIEPPSPIRTFVASDKFAEIAASQVLVALELTRSSFMRPGSSSETLPIPKSAIENWAFYHISDIWAVGVLFTHTRLAFAMVNEALKTIDNKRGVIKEIPDEACFWASMATSVVIPSLMELNIMSLFGEKINSSSDPADLFGVGVGAAVIIASHYASKYREPIKKVASLAASGIAEGGKFLAKKFKELDKHKPEKSEATFGVTSAESNRLDKK